MNDISVYTVYCTVQDLDLSTDVPITSGDTYNLFKGGVLDTGAQRSVIGLPQANAYCKYYDFDISLKPRRARFKFADHTLSSIETLVLFFPTPGV